MGMILNTQRRSSCLAQSPSVRGTAVTLRKAASESDGAPSATAHCSTCAASSAPANTSPVACVHTATAAVSSREQLRGVPLTSS